MGVSKPDTPLGESLGRGAGPYEPEPTAGDSNPIRVAAISIAAVVVCASALSVWLYWTHFEESANAPAVFSAVGGLSSEDSATLTAFGRHRGSDSFQADDRLSDSAGGSFSSVDSGLVQVDIGAAPTIARNNAGADRLGSQWFNPPRVSMARLTGARCGRFESLPRRE